MRIFLSWSGEASKQIAGTLREWLPDVLQQVEPWFSGADLAAGERWNSTLSHALKESLMGIICVTPGLLHSQWAMFEAGVLSKQMEKSSVIPYLVGLTESDIAGPLATFQMTRADKTGTWHVLEAINNLLNNSLSQERLKKQFERTWPDLEANLLRIDLQDAASSPIPKRDPAVILDDILCTVRHIDRSINGEDLQTHIIPDKALKTFSKHRIAMMPNALLLAHSAEILKYPTSYASRTEALIREELDSRLSRRIDSNNAHERTDIYKDIKTEVIN